MPRSSYINLYSKSDVNDDDLKAQIECDSAKVEWAGAQAQELTFDFGSYKFKKLDASGLADDFDLDSRFAAIENDNSSSNNASAISQLQVDLAAEQTARIAADTSNANNITAEISRATTAEGVNATAITNEASTARAAEQANAAAVTAEENARIAAVTAEETRALAAEAGLQSQITNILSNADAAVIDSIAELLSHVNTEDASLLSSIATLQSEHDALKARVDALTEE